MDLYRTEDRGSCSLGLHASYVAAILCPGQADGVTLATHHCRKDPQVSSIRRTRAVERSPAGTSISTGTQPAVRFRKVGPVSSVRHSERLLTHGEDA